MSAAVCTRESAPIHWHPRVESGGSQRVQPVLQPFRSRVDRQPDWKSEKSDNQAFPTQIRTEALCEVQPAGLERDQVIFSRLPRNPLYFLIAW